MVGFKSLSHLEEGFRVRSSVGKSGRLHVIMSVDLTICMPICPIFSMEWSLIVSE
jgi:hypothetical protein